MKKSYLVTESIESLIQQAIIDFNNTEIELDDKLYFPSDSMKYLKSGLQDRAIRFKKGFLKLPAEQYLPCVTVYEEKPLGMIKVDEIVVATAGSITDEDARAFWFKSRNDLIIEMSRIHQCEIKDSDIFSIYKLGIFFRDTDKE